MAGGQPWQQLVGFGPAEFPAYARLRFLPDPAYEEQSENDVHIDEGPAEIAQLRAVLQTLTRHTSTPDDCHFCLWDGWGSDLPGPKVVVPNRAYHLFRGSISDFDDWGMPDPAFIWPADHAWCVADDVDPHWAGIGADASAIDELLAVPRLDVVRADPLQDQPFYR